ncbi:hypothetical protein [Pseudoalteromonas viridis]|uniref:Uncharacterized protein n=1 Tax=Pseudoalteromonas viridis TaxID=339617 RepID=A0ABX7V684_9GAMM|nr:hypothetical protein [Pseudoalteromonas viridis]QTL36389.1 hypothetical protein J5X90_04900 [Pseudoalteromonas viridis]
MPDIYSNKIISLNVFNHTVWRERTICPELELAFWLLSEPCAEQYSAGLQFTTETKKGKSQTSPLLGTDPLTDPKFF